MGKAGDSGFQEWFEWKASTDWSEETTMVTE